MLTVRKEMFKHNTNNNDSDANSNNNNNNNSDNNGINGSIKMDDGDDNRNGSGNDNSGDIIDAGGMGSTLNSSGEEYDARGNY